MTNKEFSVQTTANDDGIVYIALGDLYLLMAINSIFSLRRAGNKMPVAIITYGPLSRFGETLVDRLEPIQWILVNVEASKNRLVKVRINAISPFVRSLVIDCDTEFLEDPSKMFNFLNFFDVCLKLNSTRLSNSFKRSAEIPDLGVVDSFPHWNGGVLLFQKNDATDNFFALWEESFIKANVRWDQVSLVRAVFLTDARLLSLDGRWNGFNSKKDGAAFIHHYTSRLSRELRSRILDNAQFIENTDKRAIKLALRRRNRGFWRRKVGRFLLPEGVIKGVWGNH